MPREILLKNLHPKAEEEDILLMFGLCGRVESVHIIRDNTNVDLKKVDPKKEQKEVSYTAVIRYTDNSAVNLALRMQNALVLGRGVQVEALKDVPNAQGEMVSPTASLNMKPLNLKSTPLSLNTSPPLSTSPTKGQISPPPLISPRAASTFSSLFHRVTTPSPSLLASLTHAGSSIPTQTSPRSSSSSSTPSSTLPSSTTPSRPHSTSNPPPPLVIPKPASPPPLASISPRATTSAPSLKSFFRHHMSDATAKTEPAKPVAPIIKPEPVKAAEPIVITPSLVTPVGDKPSSPSSSDEKPVEKSLLDDVVREDSAKSLSPALPSFLAAPLLPSSTSTPSSSLSSAAADSSSSLSSAVAADSSSSSVSSTPYSLSSSSSSSSSSPLPSSSVVPSSTPIPSLSTRTSALSTTYMSPSRPRATSASSTLISTPSTTTTPSAPLFSADDFDKMVAEIDSHKKPTPTETTEEKKADEPLVSAPAPSISSPTSYLKRTSSVPIIPSYTRAATTTSTGGPVLNATPSIFSTGTLNSTPSIFSTAPSSTSSAIKESSSTTIKDMHQSEDDKKTHRFSSIIGGLLKADLMADPAIAAVNPPVSHTTTTTIPTTATTTPIITNNSAPTTTTSKYSFSKLFDPNSRKSENVSTAATTLFQLSSLISDKDTLGKGRSILRAARDSAKTRAASLKQDINAKMQEDQQHGTYP